MLPGVEGLEGCKQIQRDRDLPGGAAHRAGTAGWQLALGDDRQASSFALALANSSSVSAPLA